MLFYQLQDFLFLGRLGVCCDREVEEWDVVGCGEGREIRMVGDDERDFDFELPYTLPEQQIIQTMTNLRNHDEDPRFLRHGTELEAHPQLVSRRREAYPQLLDV